MSHDLMAVLQPVIDQLQIAIDNDPALRASLRQLVKSVLAFAEEPDCPEHCATASADGAVMFAQTTPQPNAVPESGLPVTSTTGSEQPNATSTAINHEPLVDDATKPLLRPASPMQPLVRT